MGGGRVFVSDPPRQKQQGGDHNSEQGVRALDHIHGIVLRLAYNNSDPLPQGDTKSKQEVQTPIEGV